MATAKEIMNPNVRRIARDATALDVVTLMNTTGASSLIVGRANPRDTFGIVTMSDVVHKVVARGLPLSKVKTYEIMTKPVIVALPALAVKHVARLMANNHISHAPVVEDGEVIGMITLHDILTDPHLIDSM